MAKDFDKQKNNLLEEKVINIGRVTKVTQGGRHFRFSATVAVGNRKGLIGIGTGKANEVPEAIKKALQAANKNVVKISLVDNRTIPHEATYKVEIKEKCLYVTINGKNMGNLIGYRGEALYALENILKAIANKKSENRVIVRLDIENYKEKRVKALEEFANKKARIVEKTGKMITLEPMQAYERKIIHSALQNNPNVETRSIGQEPKRRIVITKK